MAGMAIAAVSLPVGRRLYPKVRRLAIGPQVADHIAFGASAGAVLGRIRSRTAQPLI
jgi:hypothetical protein